MPVEEQVVSIFAGVNGFLDPLPVDAVTRFERGLLSEIRARHGDLLKAIREKQELTDDIRGKLRAAIDGYAKTFAA
jgi:F-type H+-transporting ATPase subunit alpha